MAMTRTIPVPIHAALEVFLAPAVMAAPFVLDLGQVPAAIAIGLGVMLLSLAVQAVGPRRTIPLSAHAGFDYMIAALAIVSGFATGLATGEWTATAFLVGFGVVQGALTASTRFSVPSGA
jgi:hypothetical protein